MKLNEVYGEYVAPITCAVSEVNKTAKILILMNADGYKVEIDLSATPSNEHEAYCHLLRYKLESSVRSQFICENLSNVNEYTAFFTKGAKFGVSGLLNKQVAKKYFDLIKNHLNDEVNSLAFTRRELNWAVISDPLKYWYVDKNSVAKFSDVEPILNIKKGCFELPDHAIVQLADNLGFWGDWTKSLLKRGETKVEYIDSKYLATSQTRCAIA